MAEPLDTRLKQGILSYLANHDIVYFSPAKNHEAFCDTRHMSKEWIVRFIRTMRTYPGELDRTKQTTDPRVTAKVENPFHCNNRAAVLEALEALQQEGLVTPPKRRGDGFAITREGALAIGDTVLVDAFDTRITTGEIRTAIAAGTLPQVALDLPALPNNPKDRDSAIHFSQINAVVANVLGPNHPDAKEIMNRLRLPQRSGKT